MATLAELKAERERRSQPAPTEFGQKVEAATPRPSAVPHTDGVPEPDALPVNQRPGGFTTSASARLDELKAERARRENVATQQQGFTFGDPRVLTDSLPTGIRAIDFEGRRAPDTPFSFQGMDAPIPGFTPPELVAESKEGRKRDAAKRGVEFRVGAPAGARLAQALTLPTRGKKADALLKWFGENQPNHPDDLPIIEWDADLGQLTFNRLITQEDVDAGFEQPESIGRYRPTTIDESALTLKDMADLVNPREGLGLAGGVYGAFPTGPGRLSFMKQVGREGAFGLVGKEAGTLIQLGFMKATGAEIPDFWTEIAPMMATDTGIELAASFLGEAVGRGVTKTITGAKALGAVARGKVPTRATRGEVFDENIERQKSREAIEAMNKSDDTLFEVTEAEASGNTQLLQKQGRATANLSSKGRQAETLRHQNNQVAQKQFVKDNLSGNVPPKLQGQVLEEAREAVYKGSEINLVHAGDDIVVGPKAFKSPDGEQVGMHLRDNGEYWRIVTVGDFAAGRTAAGKVGKRKGLQGIGLGEETYEAAALEARAHGRGLQSDTTLTDDAMNQWKNLDGKESIGKVEFHPDAKFDPELERWVVEGNTIEPVARLAPLPSGLTEALVTTGVKQVRGVKGFKAIDNDFNRFRILSSNAERGVVAAEIKGNSHLKGAYLDALYENYQQRVTKGGFSKAKHDKWLKESKGTLEKLFDADDFAAIFGNPGSFRQLVESTGAANRRFTETMGSILDRSGEDTLKLLKDTDALMPQLQKLWNGGANNPQYKRAMQVLRRSSPETFRKLQGLVKEEMREKLLKYTEGQVTKKGFGNLEKLINKADRGFMSEFLGPQYFKNLNNFVQSVKITAARTGTKGIRSEAHPAGIMLARALVFKNVFGRRQRIASAAQKFARQTNGSRMAGILSDPEKLADLMAVGSNPVRSRVFMQAASRLGLLELATGIEYIEDPNTAASTFEDWAVTQINDMYELITK